MPQSAKAAAIFEIREPAVARQFLLQGLWLQRLAMPTPESVLAAIELARRISGEGKPLLPLGVLADLQTVLLNAEILQYKPPALSSISSTVVRNYEDHVLGRLTSDSLIDRVAAAIRRYSPQDRLRGVSFVVQQMMGGLLLCGVELSPAILRAMSKESPEALLREGYESFEIHGPLPELVESLENLIATIRRSAELLASEDVVALEQRMALADLSQFVAHRQLLQLTAQFEAMLPSRPVKPLAHRREVPTRVHDEDQYPVGGYASIGTRGSLESLLHSQLAYMEPEGSPDLFDAKFVRDELFYYTRDENQFLRRRRAFGFYFDGSLVEARVKDADLPAQRLVLAGALVLSAIRRLGDWLSHDALNFEVLFDPALKAEEAVFEILLQEMRHRGVATVECVSAAETVGTLWTTRAKTAQMHGLIVSSTSNGKLSASVSRLVVAGPRPKLFGEMPFSPDDENPLGAWAEMLKFLLQFWI